MSAEDTVSDAAGAISADRFVEISYDEVIPNNVALGSDKQLQRALEGWRPKYLDWWTICARPSASIPPVGPSSAM
jgi:hypothetical protein